MSSFVENKLIKKQEVKHMKLTFKYKLERLSNTKKEILKELMWHTTKVYNMVVYEIREGQVVIDENKNLNLASNPIYNYERKK